MEPLIGSIMMFAGDFAPQGWALCDGQLLPISQNQALFSIIGTTYGGDGKTTFALPDLRGRVPVQQGTGSGLSHYGLGAKGGRETVTLTVTNLPAHNHSCSASTGEPDEGTAGGYALADSKIYSSTAPSQAMNPNVIGQTGGNQPVDVRQPSLAINFIIALVGLYPQRS